jgi:nucleoside 2-deoxyribosyltransferase
MKVYLAGPEVFLPNAREILDRKIALNPTLRVHTDFAR